MIVVFMMLTLFTTIFSSEQQKTRATPPTTAAASSVTWVDVAQQENADCGYHALYNAVAQYLRQQGKSVPNISKEVLTKWRELIVARRIQNKTRAQETNGQWLDDGEVEFLKNNHLNVMPLPASTNLRSLKEHTIIIPNITKFDPTHLDLTREIQALRTTRGTLYTFVLGNMDLLNPNNRGHWIAITVHNENGQLKYYAMNSLSYKPENYAMALKELIEKSNPEQLKLSVSTALDRAQTALDRHVDVGRALALIDDEFIDIAERNNLLNDPALAPKIEQARQLLNTIKEITAGNPASGIDTQYLVMLLDKLPEVSPVAPPTTSSGFKVRKKRLKKPGNKE